MSRHGSELSEVLDSLAPACIRVVGDLILDRYESGTVHRVSPEAPIPVLDAEHHEETPGGAANLAVNLAALGAEVFLVGVVGDDDEGRRLLELTSLRGVDTDAVLVDESRPTTTKTRFVAANQQILRVDRERRAPLDEELARQLCGRMTNGPSDFVVSDYGKGAVTPSMLDAIREVESRWLADPAHGIAPMIYRGAALVTPNLAECRAGVSTGGVGPGPETAESAARAWSSLASGAPVLVTTGAAGACYFDGGAAHEMPARPRTVYDVTGAGDTTLAVIARAFFGGADMIDAIALGMIGGGMAVSRFGTAVISLDDLRAEVVGSC